MRMKPYQQAVLAEKLSMYSETDKPQGAVLSTTSDSVNIVKYKVLDHGRAMTEDQKNALPIGAVFLAKRETDNTTAVVHNGVTAYVVYLIDVIATQPN